MLSTLCNRTLAALLTILLTTVWCRTNAQNVKGKVMDASTGEPMIGATVALEGTHYSTVVNLDGTFVLKNIPAGKYQLVVSSVGYNRSKELEVNLSTGTDVKNISVSLTHRCKRLAAGKWRYDSERQHRGRAVCHHTGYGPAIQ